MKIVPPKVFRLNVFGRNVHVEHDVRGWRAFYVCAEGKKRVAQEIIIPPRVLEEDLLNYIADLCHEWAEPEHPAVTMREDDH